MSDEDQMQSWVNEIVSAPSQDKPHPQMQDWIKDIQSTPVPRDQGGPHPKLQQWLQDINANPVVKTTREPGGEVHPSVPETEKPAYKMADFLTSHIPNRPYAVGVAKNTPPDQRDDVLDAVSKLGLEKQVRGGLNLGARIGFGMGAGMLDVGESVVRAVGLEGMDEGQKKFAHRLHTVWKNTNTLHNPDAPWYDPREWLVSGGEAYGQMAAAGGGGKVLGGGAKLLGAGAKLTGIAGLVGSAASFAPGMAEESYDALLEKGVAPSTARWASAASAGLQSVIYAGIPARILPKSWVGGGLAKELSESVAKRYTKTVLLYGPSAMAGAQAVDEAISDLARGQTPEIKKYISNAAETYKRSVGTMAVLAAPDALASQWAKTHPGETPSRVVGKKIGIPPEENMKADDRKSHVEEALAKVEPVVPAQGAQPEEKLSKEPEIQLAKDIPERYKIPQQFVDDLKQDTLALKMPGQGEKDPVVLHPATETQPALEGEDLGTVRVGGKVKTVIATDFEAAKLIFQNDPKKKSEYGELTNAGNHQRYDFIPDDQYWVDRSVGAKELPKWIVHEAVEDHLMAEHGLSYDKPTAEHPESAHDIATKVEQGWANESPGGDVHQQKNPVPAPEGIRKPGEDAKKLTPTKDPMLKRLFAKGNEPATPSRIGAAVRDLMGILSPQSAGGNKTRQVGHTIRKGEAQIRNWDEISQHDIGQVDSIVSKLSHDQRMESMFAMDTGEPQATPELQAFAEAIKKNSDNDREMLQARGLLKDYYENYFGRLFKAKAGSDGILGKLITKTLRKSGFLKKRKFITMREAVEAGMEPVTDNPAEMALMVSHNIHEYLGRTDWWNELKHQGNLKFVPQDHEKDYLPNGYAYTNDPMGVVKTHGDVTIREVYNKLKHDVVQGVASALGVKTIRTTKMPEGVAGLSVAGDKPYVKTLVGSSLSTLYHEIGHQIGDMFGLYNYMTEGQNAGLRDELNKLAALRYEGIDASKSFKAYAHDPSEMEAVMLEAWMENPRKMEEVAPNATKVWKEFLQANEQLRPLLHIDESLVIGHTDTTIPQPGEHVLGRWAAPIDSANIINNMISTGLRNNQYAAVKGFYRTAKAYGNAQNQSTLSLSVRHGLFITKESIESAAQLGMQQMARGDLAQGIGTFLKAPLAPVSDLIHGKNVRKAMLQQLETIDNPKLKDEYADMLIAGASRSMNSQYTNSTRKALRETWHDFKQNAGLDKLAPGIKLPIQALFAGIEATASPIMEHYIPAMKVGAFLHQAADLHARAEKMGLNEFQITEQLSQKWDSIENRMGEMTLSNKFWNQYLTDAAQLSVRSTGWNVGTLAEYGGAATDIATTKARMQRGGERFSDKQAYVLANALTTATIGTIATWAFTGHGPQSLKDLIAIPTGSQAEDGSEERINLADYIVDMISWAAHPGQTAMNKMHPMWGGFVDMYRNRDFFSDKIYNEDDGYVKQFADAALFLAKSWEPYSITNFNKMEKHGMGKVGSIVAGAVGAHPAPASWTKSPALNLANQYLENHIPQGARTAKQVADSARRKALVSKWREYKKTGVEPTEADKVGVSPKDRSAARRAANHSPLYNKVAKISMDEMLKVYDKATPEERADIVHAIRSRRNTKGIDEDLKPEYDRLIPPEEG